MQTKKNNIILKNLIILFLIIVMPLILLSSISLIVSNHKLTQETLNSYSEKTQVFVDILDNNFNQINKSAATILSHSNLRKLSYLSLLMDPYEKSQIINHLREYISNFKNSNSLISNLKIYVHSLLQAYNADGYKKGSYQDITEAHYQDLLKLKTDMPSSILYNDGSLIMLLYPSFDNPRNIVEVEFSLNNLKKEFTKQSLYDNSYYLFDFNQGEYRMDNIYDKTLYQAILSTTFKDNIANINHNGVRYQAFYADFDYINASYIQIIPSSAFLQPLWLSNIYTIFFIVFIFICVFIFFLGVIKLIHRPLLKLIIAFQKVETGDLSIRIQEKERNEFSYLYKGFNDMAHHLETLIDEVYNQKLLLQKAEFKQLQAQINPHFLYNSFFMLQRMIKNEMQEESLKVSKELGIYFQYITRNTSDSVYFKDEYRHAKIYSNIQAMRFDGRITTEFSDLPSSYEILQVPRLILQPIIENAYNHGLENKISEGFLRVSFQSMDTGLSIIIEDNGDDLTDEKLNQINADFLLPSGFIKSAEVTGLINIYKRIQTFFKNESTLFVTRSDLGGLKVNMFLAKKDGENK